IVVKSYPLPCPSQHPRNRGAFRQRRFPSVRALSFSDGFSPFLQGTIMNFTCWKTVHPFASKTPIVPRQLPDDPDGCIHLRRPRRNILAHNRAGLFSVSPRHRISDPCEISITLRRR